MEYASKGLAGTALGFGIGGLPALLAFCLAERSKIEVGAAHIAGVLG